MIRPLRIVLLVGVFIALVIGVAWGGILYRNHAIYGTVVTESTLSITVDQGDRVSFSVPDRGASVGDNWKYSIDPTDRLAFVEHRHVVDNLVERFFGSADGGGAGTAYFLFDAQRPGEVEVTLNNCFQGCGGTTPSPESRSIIWRVTIR